MCLCYYRAEEDTIEVVFEVTYQYQTWIYIVHSCWASNALKHCDENDMTAESLSALAVMLHFLRELCVFALVAFSALTLLVGSRKGIRPVKNGGMVDVGTG